MSLSVKFILAAPPAATQAEVLKDLLRDTQGITLLSIGTRGTIFLNRTGKHHWSAQGHAMECAYRLCWQRCRSCSRHPRQACKTSNGLHQAKAAIITNYDRCGQLGSLGLCCTLCRGWEHTSDLIDLDRQQSQVVGAIPILRPQVACTQPSDDIIHC